jgi:addiction module HigA family antidote
MQCWWITRIIIRHAGRHQARISLYRNELMTRMHNPPHPGEVLKDGVFADGAVSITDAAAALGVTRVSLSRVLNGKAGVSAEMAVRLGKWLGTGPETWINMQAQYELWKAEQALKRQVMKIPPLKLAA